MAMFLHRYHFTLEIIISYVFQHLPLSVSLYFSFARFVFSFYIIVLYTVLTTFVVLLLLLIFGWYCVIYAHNLLNIRKYSKLIDINICFGFETFVEKMVQSYCIHSCFSKFKFPTKRIFRYFFFFQHFYHCSAATTAIIIAIINSSRTHLQFLPCYRIFTAFV